MGLAKPCRRSPSVIEKVLALHQIAPVVEDVVALHRIEPAAEDVVALHRMDSSNNPPQQHFRCLADRTCNEAPPRRLPGQKARQLGSSMFLRQRDQLRLAHRSLLGCLAGFADSHSCSTETAASLALVVRSRTHLSR